MSIQAKSRSLPPSPEVTRPIHANPAQGETDAARLTL